MNARKQAARTRKHWTEAEKDTVRARYANEPTATIAADIGRTVRAVYMLADYLKLKKSADYIANAKPGQLDGIRGGATRFKKGLVPANKGLRRPGWHRGRMQETQFKKGQMAGAAQKKWVPVGTEVLCPDGYLKRKVRDDAPPNFSRLNWKFVHVMLWEEHLGPVPKGFNVSFKNGDKRDIRIDNLALVHRSENMRRNSYHTNYPKEIARVIQLRGALTRQINRGTRNVRAQQ